MFKIKTSLSEFFFYVIIFVAGTLIYQSCTKNYYFEQPEHRHHYHYRGTPSITSFTPLSGPKNTQVTVNGTGFSTIAADNIVTFNSIRATVVTATATTLVVSVPRAAGDGKISVSTGGPLATSANDFKFQYTVSTLAGDTARGFADGTGRAARFDAPYAVVIDANNDLLVTDLNNDRVRKITPAGVVTSAFGSNAGLRQPTAITIDAASNIYIADTNTPRIHKITPSGVASILAGGSVGFTDGQGASAKFEYPFDMTADAAGNIYVIDIFNQRLRKITPAGVVSTIAGDGAAGYQDGPALNAQFANPTGVAFDPAGNIYIADGLNYVIRKITPGGIVSTFAGNHTKGLADGPVANAQFGYASKIKFDPAGNMYITDAENNNVRRITPAGIVSTIAGSMQGFADGVGANAKFFAPHGIALGADGTIYIVDAGNNCIRKLD